MYEATFRIEGDGSYAVATADTGASVELWCNEHCDLLYVVDDTTDEMLARIRDRVGVQELLRRPNESVIITDSCLQQHESDLIETYLVRHNCLLVPPVRYAAGAKSCRLLALEPASLTACYRDLITDGHTVTVERKRELDTVTHDAPLLLLDDVLPDFSSRQREILHTAYDRGYYDIPRQTTTADIATAVGVERRTAEEHLRRAEKKLITAVIDYIRT